MHNVVFEHLKEDITLIRKEKTNHGYKYRLSDHVQKQLEKFSLKFSSFNPFPSWPSAAKDTCQQFQYANIAIVNKMGHYF